MATLGLLDKLKRIVSRRKNSDGYDLFDEDIAEMDAAGTDSSSGGTRGATDPPSAPDEDSDGMGGGAEDGDDYEDGEDRDEDQGNRRWFQRPRTPTFVDRIVRRRCRVVVSSDPIGTRDKEGRDGGDRHSRGDFSQRHGAAAFPARTNRRTPMKDMKIAWPWIDRAEAPFRPARQYRDRRDIVPRMSASVRRGARAM